MKRKSAYWCLTGLSAFVLSACGTSASPEVLKSAEPLVVAVAEKELTPQPKTIAETPQPDDPKDIGGYGKSRWGMTEEQVLKAEADRVERLDEPKAFHSDIARLTIRRFEINGMEYEVFFCFDQNESKLVRVLIRSLEGNGQQNDYGFVSLEKLLTEKYGPPTFSTSGKQQWSDKIASWKLAKTSIRLSHSGRESGESLLTLMYEPVEIAKKASNAL